MSDTHKAQAALDLYGAVKEFNENFRSWEDLYNYRANFCFKYDEHSGRKSLDIADIEPVNTAAITAAQLQAAGETIQEALEQVEEPSFVPPELQSEPVRYPELTKVTNDLQNELKTKVKNTVSLVLMDILKENDLLLLSALGIDGRQKILDVFIEECQALKEGLNGTSRSGNWARTVS
jgi:hypothetical protein